MSESPTLPNPVLPSEPRCQLEALVPPGFLELMRLVPRNPLVRALILKLAGKLPPLECRTFEALKGWIEANCEPQAVSLFNRRNRHANGEGIRIAVDFSETEYGRADYSVRRHGREEFQVEGDNLMEIIQDTIEAGGGMDEIVEIIASRIDDDAWNRCDPNMDDYGDYDYNEHDSTDTADSEAEFSRNEIRDAVLTFVRERHPELAAEL